MLRYRLLTRISLLLLAAAVITGCSPQSSHPDRLTVTRSNPLHQPDVPPLQVTIIDAKLIQELYNRIMQLPAFTSGIIHCPNDNGISYHLAFQEQGSTVLTADAKASGCEAVTTSRGTFWSMEPKGDGFRPAFAQVLGIAELRLWAY